MVTPRVHDSELTELVPIEYEELLGAATFTTISLLPYSDQYSYDFMSGVVNSLPIASLHLGKNTELLVKKIKYISSNPPNYAKKTRKLDKQVVPLISIVIPVYNGAGFIKDAIANIVSQNYSSYEVTIIDDGSTDDIERVIADLPIDVRFHRRDNSGAAAARNAGLMDTAGEYVAFLDVDDLWPENNLTYLANFLVNNPDIDVVKGYPQNVVIDDSASQKQYVGDPVTSFPYFLGTALFRKSVFDTVGIFDPKLRMAEDTDWFLRANDLEIGIKQLDRITLLRQIHGDNASLLATQEELRPFRMIKKAFVRMREKETQNNSLSK